MLLLDWISQSVYVCVSSQEPLVNKGDMHTFSTNNEEEKTQYNEEEKDTVLWAGMIELNILKQTLISEHILIQNSV